MKRFVCLLGLPIVLSASSLTAPRASADPIGDGLQTVTQKVGPAVVSIRAVEKFTLLAKGNSRDTDVAVDFHGAVISPDGLIMCSNTYFSGDRYKDATGIPEDSTDVTITLVPREIRVTVGNEPTEYYATIAASDSNLGLDFLQIRDLKGRTLPFIDLTNASSVFVAPSIGQPTASVTRLDKIHDFATLAIEDRVASILDKPRKGFLPEGDAGSLGLPVCSIDGSVIGVITSLPSPPQNTEDRQTEMFAHLYNDDLSIEHTEIIVPVTAISPLVAEAKTQAAALPPFTPPAPKPVVAPTTKPDTTNTPSSAPVLPTPAPGN